MSVSGSRRISKRLLIQAFFSALLVSPSCFSYLIGSQEIENAIGNVENGESPIYRVINQEGNTITKMEVLLSGGSLVVLGSGIYSYRESCHDRKKVVADLSFQIDGNRSGFKLDINKFYEPSEVSGTAFTKLYLDAHMYFKEKYEDPFGNCQTGFPDGTSVDVSTSIEAVGEIEYKAYFQPSLMTKPSGRKVVELKPKGEVYYKAYVDDSDVDFEAQFSPTTVGLLGALAGGAVLTTGGVVNAVDFTGLSQFVFPTVASVVTLGVWGDFDDEVEDYAKEKLEDYIISIDDELQQGVTTPIDEYLDTVIFDLPPGAFLSESQYRDLMRNEGVGGFNCGPGKDDQASAIYALLAGSLDPDAYRTYIKPEIGCRALPAILAVSL